MRLQKVQHRNRGIKGDCPLGWHVEYVASTSSRKVTFSQCSQERKQMRSRCFISPKMERLFSICLHHVRYCPGTRLSCPSNIMEEADVASGPCVPSAPVTLSLTRSTCTTYLELLAFLSSWGEHVPQISCSQCNMSASDVCPFWVDTGKSQHASSLLSLPGGAR